MEYRGLYFNPLGPFSVESTQQPVSSGVHLGSGSLLNGPDSEQPHGFSEANTIGPYEGIWVPFMRQPAGQTTSCQPSGGIGTRVGIHPPTHVPGRGKCGLYCIGSGEEGVALSTGEMNKEE